MASAIAQDIEAKERTADVNIKTFMPFSKMVLSKEVQNGLEKTRFVYPTNVQATAIPVGKSGMDLMVQSKSGTGKTVIFCVIVLEAYHKEIHEPQSLIVAPTREIAVQINCVLNEIGHYCSGFRSVAVIGGLDVTEDRKNLFGAKAIVGTPGRIMHLIQNDVLNTSRIRLLVLDEADKMYSSSFRRDIERIRSALPLKKLQIVACSATMGNELDQELAKMMRNPLLISTENRATLLVGIKQFVYELPEFKTSIAEMNAKLDALKKIFSKIAFRQCIVFANSQTRANSYKNYLEKEGWPCELFSAALDQKARLDIFKKLRTFKIRILIATDIMSRGIDSENINLVINMECPNDVVTYLHRIGRAGRFGSHGIAISFISSADDRIKFSKMITDVGTGMNVLKFPKCDKAMECDFWDFTNYAAEEKIYGCFGDINTAPLAVLEDNSSILSTDTTNEEQKENIADNNIVVCSSSIDTKTFQLNSSDSALNVKELPIMDREETNLHMLTPESRQDSSQQLPSSNTIDDASSIAADSDIVLQNGNSGSLHDSDFQSILKEKTAIPTLVEFLVDHSGAKKINDEIDFFDDYKEALDQISQKSTKDDDTSESLRVTAQKVADYKSLLIDQTSSKNSNTPVLASVKKDIYSDYANFGGDEDEEDNSASAVESIISQTTTCAEEQEEEEDIDKGTFILSVATPSPRESDTNLEMSQHSFTSEDSPSFVPEKKHFPSPANVVDPLLQQQGSEHPGLPFVAIGNDHQNSPSPINSCAHSPTLTNPSCNMSQQSDNNISPGAHVESPDITASSGQSVVNSNRSSGFDEKPTSSGSSGIVASDQCNVPAGDVIIAAPNTPTECSYAEQTDDDEDENYFNEEESDEGAVGGDNVKYADYEDEDNGDEKNHHKMEAAQTSHSDRNEKSECAGVSEADEVFENDDESEEEDYFKENNEQFSRKYYQSEGYQAAHARWMANYWQQVTLIQDYSKFFIKSQKPNAKNAKKRDSRSIRK